MLKLLTKDIIDVDLSAPDFIKLKLAQAFGAKGTLATTPEALNEWELNKFVAKTHIRDRMHEAHTRNESWITIICCANSYTFFH